MKKGEGKMKIASSLIPPEEIQEELKEQFPTVDFQFFKGIDKARPALKECEVFITYGFDLTEEDILLGENLKWLMVMSAGIDKIPLKICREKGILVTNVKGIHKIPMAEYTLGMMLQYEKKLKQMWINEQNNKWYRRLPFGELAGKTVLIFGTGAIGSEIARLAKAFRMKTLGVNRSGNSVENIDELFTRDNFEKALPEADYIVSILPSTEETRYFFKEEHFKKMKESAVFINIGRGDVVRDEVIITALNNDEIAHAILDVFEDEPLNENHPFWTMEKVTVTPHASSLSRNYLPRAFEIFVKNLHTYLKKEDDDFINKIDYFKGY